METEISASTLEALLAAHARRYPAMQAVDFAKLLYQQEFGCGHLVPDEAYAAARLREEMDSCAACGQLTEPLGNGWTRVYLREAKDLGLSPDVLARMFTVSAARQDGNGQRFLAKLAVAQAYTDDQSLHALAQRAQENGFSPFSHSQTYRDAYHPAYRVIAAPLANALTLVARIDQLRHGSRVVVGLDGRCGSGKSTLAHLLSQVFGCGVVHMDDFYLPASRRTPERMARVGGNIEFERFETEVSQAIRRGGAFSYARFSCLAQCLAEDVLVPDADVVIVEGSYALHPQLRDLYTIKAFCDVPADVQQSRLLSREGKDGLAAFNARWIPREERYFAETTVLAVCDEVIRNV